jgi:hypothetical protein
MDLLPQAEPALSAGTLRNANLFALSIRRPQSEVHLEHQARGGKNGFSSVIHCSVRLFGIVVSPIGVRK